MRYERAVTDLVATLRKERDYFVRRACARALGQRGYEVVLASR